MILKPFILTLILQIAAGEQLTLTLLDHVRRKLEDFESYGNVSERCQTEIVQILDDPLAFLKMYDASTKVPEGMLHGRIYQLGDYDECVNTESKNGSETVYGQYCLGYIPLSALGGLGSNMHVPNQKHLQLDPHTPGFNDDQNLMSLSVAMCIPSGCTPEEVADILSLTNITFNPSYCYSQDTAPKLTGGAIFTMVFFLIIILMAAAATGYDLYLSHTEKKTLHPILTAFSLTTNAKKLLKSSSSNPNALLCLNGLKAMSIMWVVLGHQYTNILGYVPIGNMVDHSHAVYNRTTMWITGSTVSVDTFFVCGGLLTVYVFLRALKKGVQLNIPMYYLHRYFRLTPVFAVMMLVEVNLVRYFSDGPLWAHIDPVLGEPCRKGWWSSLLYIHNYEIFHNRNVDFCVPNSWYLNLDMQLFMLSPLVLVPLARWPKKTLYGMCIAIGFGSVSSFIVGWQYDIMPHFIRKNGLWSDTSDFFFIYYIQVYTRFGPYVMGMILGYYVYKIKHEGMVIKLTKVQVTILWIVTGVLMLVCIHAGYDLVVNEKNKWPNSIHLALNRPAWSLCVCWVILACLNGYAGPVNTFLSLPVFELIAKLTYCIYLVHVTFLIVAMASIRYHFTVTWFGMSLMYCGMFTFILFLSIVLYLFFELPMATVESIIFGGLIARKSKGIQAKPNPPSD